MRDGGRKGRGGRRRGALPPRQALGRFPLRGRPLLPRRGGCHHRRRGSRGGEPQAGRQRPEEGPLRLLAETGPRASEGPPRQRRQDLRSPRRSRRPAIRCGWGSTTGPPTLPAPITFSGRPSRLAPDPDEPESSDPHAPSTTRAPVVTTASAPRLALRLAPPAMVVDQSRKATKNCDRSVT